MGKDDPSERMAVLETEMLQVKQEVRSLKESQKGWSLQELLIFISVLGTLIAMIAKGLGWTQ